MNDAPSLGMIEAPEGQPTRNLCWNCRSDVGGDPQCPQCVRLQPLGAGSDYFRVLGLPRKLQINPAVLEPVFHALSRRFHPDMYRTASPRERMIALENSAVLNKAYRTLRDPFERARYLLELEQGRIEQQKDAPPQELLEEILELQELLAEFQMAEADERSALQPALQEKRATLQAEQDRAAAELTGPLSTQWDALQPGAHSPEERERLLDRLRDGLNARAYLRRALDTLRAALPSS